MQVLRIGIDLLRPLPVTRLDHYVSIERDREALDLKPGATASYFCGSLFQYSPIVVVSFGDIPMLLHIPFRRGDSVGSRNNPRNYSQSLC